MEDIVSVFNKLNVDKLSGSSQLVEQLISGLNEFTRQHPPGLLIDKKMISVLLLNCRKQLSSFAVVQHFVSWFLSAIDKQEKFSVYDIEKVIEAYQIKWSNINERIAEITIERFDFSNKSILVNSNSGAIRTFFKSLSKKNIQAKLMQTESRPLNEGRLQARAIADLGFEVSYITDAAIMLLAKDADCILCGADAVYRDCFINKTGTFNLLLAAAYVDVPVYLLCDSRKIIKKSTSESEFQIPEYDPDKVWLCRTDNIKVRNFYFEPVPLGLVNYIISESGIVCIDDLNKK